VSEFVADDHARLAGDPLEAFGLAAKEESGVAETKTQLLADSFSTLSTKRFRNRPGSFDTAEIS
jgi:hypothetical protein